MNTVNSERYNGWKIEVGREDNLCSHFYFDITDHDGNTQHVVMGGDSRERAFERAREMIDMEIEFNTGAS